MVYRPGGSFSPCRAIIERRAVTQIAWRRSAHPVSIKSDADTISPRAFNRDVAGSRSTSSPLRTGHAAATTSCSRSTTAIGTLMAEIERLVNYCFGRSPGTAARRTLPAWHDLRNRVELALRTPQVNYDRQVEGIQALAYARNWASTSPHHQSVPVPHW